MQNINAKCTSIQPTAAHILHEWLPSGTSSAEVQYLLRLTFAYFGLHAEVDSDSFADHHDARVYTLL